MLFNRQVYRRVPDPQVVDLQSLQRCRKPRTRKADLGVSRLDRDSQTRLENAKHRCCRPRLGRTRHGVERWPFSGSAIEATKQLGKSMQLKEDALHQTTLSESAEQPL